MPIQWWNLINLPASFKIFISNYDLNAQKIQNSLRILSLSKETVLSAWAPNNSSYISNSQLLVVPFSNDCLRRCKDKIG